MGEIADYYRQQEEDQQFSPFDAMYADWLKEQETYSQTHWVTLSGKELLITDMTLKHVQNCIAFLERRNEKEGKNKVRDNYIKIFNSELKRRKS